MAAKKKSFEEAMNRLEEIVSLLEDEQNLEDSVKFYKEGIDLSKYCSEILGGVEKEVTILQESSSNKFVETPFDS